MNVAGEIMCTAYSVCVWSAREEENKKNKSQPFRGYFKSSHY